MKKFLPHFIAVGIFIAISAIYFSPVLKGKVLNMSDIIQYKGMSREIQDHRINYDEETQWTGTSFSGMPSYQSGLRSNGNLIQYVDKALQLGLPRPMNMLFMYLIGFYILLLTLKIDYKLAIVGAIGFAFSSYFIIILQVGHMTKAHAIAYLPLIVASVLYTFRREKWLLGASFTSLFVALQLYSNHYQITYYTAIILFFIGVIQFAKELQKKTLSNFFKKTGILFIAASLGVATNYTRLATTMEYAPETQRGKSELINQNGQKKDDGMTFEYITDYSYGISETMTFLIPNFMGGPMGRSVLTDSDGKLNKDSETYEYLGTIKNQNKQRKLQEQTSSYWGDKGAGAPTYVGAIMMFLFILGILYIKSSFRIWILLATILSIMLGWGHNFAEFSRFFIDFIPGYGKFRAVTMIMIIAEFGIALLAILALNKFLNKEDNKEKEQKLKLAFYITGGITLLLALIPSLFLLDFLSPNDVNNKNQPFLNALTTDRESILKSDAWRSFVYILLSSGVLWMFLKGSIRKQYVVIILGVLIISDMWSVDKRYLNDTHFVKERNFRIQKIYADDIILNNNLNKSRVLDKSVQNYFSSSRASFFHNSIGGYSAAKLKRYQELYDICIRPTQDTLYNGKMITIPVPAPNKSKILSMLNCGWVIESKDQAFRSEKLAGFLPPLGNAWFVSEVNIVENANQEMESFNSLNPAVAAIVDKRFSGQITDLSFFPNSATITLNHDKYKPNHLIYNLTNITSKQLAVFSEIYYEKGWNAYIDGKVVPHFRANYVLRAMMVPAGTTKIEFKFESTSYSTGETVAYVSSIILLLLLGFVSYKEFK